MRSRFALLLAALSLTACTIVVQPAPSGSTVVTRPTPDPIIPLEITLARPVSDRLFVQTNRPAYVALFEIVPGQGVTLVRPGSVAQRTVVYSGMTWVPAWWTTQRASSMVRGRLAPDARRTRYVYAIAADRPLNIPDRAFQPDGMRMLIGTAAYDASSPSVTIRALRRFAPAVRDEMWAEDALLLSRASAPEQLTHGIVRVYCANGTVYQVPAEVADHVYCPVTTAGAPSLPPAPDSVLHDNGRRVQRRPAEPPGRRRIDRVGELPTDVGENDANDDKGGGRPYDRGESGQRLGHTDPTKPGGGRADPGRPEQTGRPRTPAADTTRRDTAVTGRSDRGRPADAGRGSAPGQAGRDSTTTAPGNPGPKPETKPEPKPETKPEPKPENKPEPKPESKPEPKPENKPEPVPESKPEPQADKPAPEPARTPEKRDSTGQAKPKHDDKSKPQAPSSARDKAKPDSAADSAQGRLRRRPD